MDNITNSSPDKIIDSMERIARRVRRRIIELSYCSKTPHLGGSLSCVEILVAAYWSLLRIDPQNPTYPDRDRLIFSKGHAALALFSTLAERGYFPQELLDTFAKPGSSLEEHPSLGSAPGVEISSGSLGHGLSIGVGMALAARIRKLPYRVVVVMSDGECEEGSVWEAALFAPIHCLNNLITIIDYNKWQATGRSNEVMALQPLARKWEAFGWQTYELDGHDLKALIETFQCFPGSCDKPTAVIAHTIKGKGISFMEDDNNWHYRIPTADEVIAANKELGLL